MKVASSTCCITPKKKVTLGCNGFNQTLFESIDSDIEINAIRLIQNNTNVIMIAVDTLFVTNEIKTFAIDYLKDKLPIKEDQIFIAASHTHYAPFLDASKPNLGSVDDEYMVFFKSQLSLLLDHLVQAEFIECDLVYSESETDEISVSRRKYAWGFWKRMVLRKWMRMFPNNNQAIDSKLRVFQLICKNTKQCMGLIWNFACHPVMYHSPMNVSAHFPGDVRTGMRQVLGDIPVVFLQGFSGDVRPNNVDSGNSFKSMLLKRLNKAAEFQAFTQQTYKQWVETLIQGSLGCIQKKYVELKPTEINTNHVNVPLEKLLIKGQGSIYFHAIELSNTHVILGVSAEVVSAYSIKLQAQYPNKIIVPVGCIGTVFGYWPTKQMISEGGYEVNGFKKGFSFEGEFNEDAIENAFFESIKTLIK